jgi:isopentenyl-diphosphate delta-isomerase
LAGLEQAGPARVVSSEAESLILVDKNDRELGTLSKAECHDGEGILHRAFSVFLFDDRDRLLIQQRAMGKRLWPGYWANSCCSHPRAGEDMSEATRRRTFEELGMQAELDFIYKFRYQAHYKNFGSEHELCWVYVGRTHQTKVRPNPSELADWRFITLEEADALVADEKAPVAPWFRLEWTALQNEHREKVAGVLGKG